MNEYPIINDLAQVPDHSYISMVMRHSNRYPIMHPEDVFKVGLTPLGVNRAEDFGKELSEFHRTCGKLVSTPVGRCVDTANAIARGAGWHIEAVTDEAVSYPFIENIYQTLLQQETPQNSRLPVEITSILSRITMHSGNHLLDVYITHDSVIDCILGYLIGEKLDQQNWVEFLEGFVIWREADHAVIRWRGRCYEIDLSE